MKKYIFYTIPFLICSVVAFVIYDVNHVSRKEYHKLIENHPIQERLKLSKNERKKLGIPPNRYFDDQYLLEMDPATGKTYPENLQEVRAITNGVRFSSVPGESQEMAWEERGPDNIGGRTRVVFYDPNDATGKRVFAGGVSGGLWLNNDITDENSTWVQVGIDENLAISCFAIDPNDSNTWYIGTGESYTGDDGTGNGIWRSTNGGATWSSYISPNLNNDPTERIYFVTQILAWDNNGSTELFFALDGQFDVDPVGFLASGWYKVEGDSTSRINFLTPEGTPYVFSDVEIAVDNSIWVGTKSNLFGNGGGKIFRSTDGENFTEKYTFTDGGRVELAVSRQDENVVYGLCSVESSTAVDLVRTLNGVSFITIAKPNDVDTDISSDDFARNQGFYNLTLEVDPDDDFVLYAGGIDLFSSTDSGSSWDQISKWSNNNNLSDLNVSLVHADQHAVVIDPNNSNHVIFANDGGVYYSSNIGIASSNTTAIESRNKGYNITQFYSGAIGQDTENEMLLGGTQDNGSLFGFEITSGVNSFVDIFGGDGVETFIDKDGEYLIVSFIHNVYGAYPLPLNSFNDLVLIIDDQSSGSFVNIADLDDNLDLLYTDATLNNNERIARYSDLIGSPSVTYFSDSQLFEDPTAIKVSPYTTNSSTVFIGTEGATLLKVSGLNTSNPTWTNIDVDSSVNVGSISDIDFGTNEDEILVTLHNYGVNNIYYTQNGGQTWLVKDGDFVDIPVKSIKMNPLDSNEVIIGTNAGVWKTSNFMSDSPNWIQSQNGMSSVRVTSFDTRTSDNTVLASTYGRGLFTGAFGGDTLIDTDSDIDVDPDDDLNVDTDEELDIDSDTETSVEKISVLDNLKIVDQHLVFSEINKAFRVSVFSLKGQVLIQENIDPSGGDTQSVSVSFQPGVYVLKIWNEDEVSTKKIVIE